MGHQWVWLLCQKRFQLQIFTHRRNWLKFLFDFYKQYALLFCKPLLTKKFRSQKLVQSVTLCRQISLSRCSDNMHEKLCEILCLLCRMMYRIQLSALYSTDMLYFCTPKLQGGRDTNLTPAAKTLYLPETIHLIKGFNYVKLIPKSTFPQQFYK